MPSDRRVFELGVFKGRGAGFLRVVGDLILGKDGDKVGVRVPSNTGRWWWQRGISTARWCLSKMRVSSEEFLTDGLCEVDETFINGGFL